MSKSWLVKLALALGALTVIGLASAYLVYQSVSANLPKIITVKDYQPNLVSQVYDRNQEKVGEFFLERRTLIPYEKMPKNLVNAFLAAEDSQFFQHGGLNYQAILRAFIANMKAGHTVQGGSTITQQVAKTFFLSDEKKLIRKAKEALLAFELEKNLTKENILYLYLNQIYFGNSAYGIENAAQTYFRKPAEKLELNEMAMLAGLPKAPSENSPITNPRRAKERQVYVLKRMAEVGFITREEADTEINKQIKVYVKENYDSVAPYYLEVIRQMLIQKLGEETVFKKGIKIYASLDVEKQKVAQAAMMRGLKNLDKRQGYRGPLGTLTDSNAIEEYFTKYRRRLILQTNPERTITVEGEFAEEGLTSSTPSTSRLSTPRAAVGQKAKAKAEPVIDSANLPSHLPSYMSVQESYEGLVTKIDDSLGIVYVRLPESHGVIDFESMKWARKPDPDKRFDMDQITKASQALKVGDLILVRVLAEKPSFNKNPPVPKPIKGKPAPLLVKGPDLGNFLHLELDQEPLAEGGLISFDQQTEDILALVGGYSFNRNKLIRAFQALRQTGSAFKALVYASALDKGFTPSTLLMDSPVVFEEPTDAVEANANKNGKKSGSGVGRGGIREEDREGQIIDTKTWKPNNHGKSFGGEITFRNALVRSLNVPTVKVIEDVGVQWVAEYSRRLGVFSSLNMDFSLALGSSSLSLYEMTKVFSEIGRLGKRIRPRLIQKVVDSSGQVLIENVSLDDRFIEQTRSSELAFEERRVAYLESLKEAETKPEDGKVAESTSSIEPETAAIRKSKKDKPDKYLFFEDPDQLIRPQTAFVMTTLLKGVIEDPRGTGGMARALGREAAGKTGSSSSYVDAWFLGYTPQIASGVWVGYDQEKSLGLGEVGGRSALPIWIEYMKAAHENLPEIPFKAPEGIIFANIDAASGELASASSKNVIRQAFIEGTEPIGQSKESEDATDFLKRDLSE